MMEGSLEVPGLKEAIRNIPDFPQKGVLFRDITPILKNPPLFQRVVDVLVEHYRPRNVEGVAAIEARGFIFAAPIALGLNVPLIPIRKGGKLPWKTYTASYELEYGVATIEMHQDAVSSRQRVLLFDDVLATGGTARAAAQLLEQGAAKVVSIAFLVELTDLKGRQKLSDYEVVALVKF